MVTIQLATAIDFKDGRIINTICVENEQFTHQNNVVFIKNPTENITWIEIPYFNITAIYQSNNEII